MPSIYNEPLSLDVLQKSEFFQRKALQKLTSRGELDKTPAEDFETPFKLLPGEQVQYYSCMNNKTLIVLTNFRFFVDLNGKQGFYNILIRSIDTVECREIFYLHVYCKDGRFAKIVFDNNESCLVWFRLLVTAANPPMDMNELFAFAFHAWCNDDSTVSLCDMGFKTVNKSRNFSSNAVANGEPSSSLTIERRLKEFVYDDFDNKSAIEKEYDRLGFIQTYWRITSCNESYKVCSTYPKYWIVPSSITDQDIDSACRYRSLRRGPAVVWRHKNNGAVLVRCSQPESGIFGWRSPADETLLQAIYFSAVKESQITIASSTNNVLNGDQQLPTTNVKPMLILDARSYAAAWANRAKGGGFESAENYQKCEIQFLGLANIHSIRYSFQKMRALLWDSSAEGNFFQNLDATQWVYHCWALLSSSLRVVQALQIEGRSVLVHCSDGWDRTTQIVSLSKLLLDSYYRTMNGFKELIEREWIAFGHKFGERSGLLPGDPSQRAPVFLQWLDCVRYIMHENRCAFEFNEIYLVKLAQHVYSGLFGTFLCNSVCEYLSKNVGPRTLSIWSYLHPENCHFRNLLYVSHQRGVLMPRLQPRDLAEIWRAVYYPADDPSNVRPRSFSTTSTDDKIDRSLTRAHSCDNLTGGSGAGSTDNLLHLHRTGSDSSLTAPTKSNVSLHNLNVSDKDAVEESLKHLLNNVELGEYSSLKSLVNKRRHSTSETFAPVHSTATRNEKMCNEEEKTSVNDEAVVLSSSVPQTVSFVDPLISFTSINKSKDEESFVASPAATKRNELLPSHIGTSTSDLTDSVVVRFKTNGADHINFNGGIINSCAPVKEPNAPKFQPSVINKDSPHIETNQQIATSVRVPHCCAEVTKSIARKDKRLPSDLLDNDGLRKLVDPTQQRVRDIILDYEKRLELRQIEIDRLKSCLTRQEQNGYYSEGVDCGDRLKNGRTSETNGDLFEPTSLDSRGSEASWEALDDQDSRPVLWVPDHASSRCMSCGSEFWAIKRKHHCRSCGKLFCNECSNYECPVPEEQLFDPVRVCYKCYESLCTTNGIVPLL